MSSRPLFTACLAFLCLPLVACGPSEATVATTDDGLDEVEGALCSANDVGGLTEGSADAQGVLQAANTLSESALKADVGLTTLASHNIAQARATHAFATLKDLSAVCQVGNAAIAKLLAYAKAHVPPPGDLPFADCGGDLTPLELQGLYSRMAFLTVKAERYARTCNQNQGAKSCGAWAPSAIDVPADAYGSGLANAPTFEARVEVSNGLAQIGLQNPASSGYWGVAVPGATSSSGTAIQVTLSYQAYKDVCDDFGWNTFRCLRSHHDYWNATWLTMGGTVSERCLRVADPVAKSNEVTFGPGVTTYTETVRTLTSAP